MSSQNLHVSTVPSSMVVGILYHTALFVGAEGLSSATQACPASTLPRSHHPLSPSFSLLHRSLLPGRDMCKWSRWQKSLTPVSAASILTSVSQKLQDSVSGTKKKRKEEREMLVGQRWRDDDGSAPIASRAKNCIALQGDHSIVNLPRALCLSQVIPYSPQIDCTLYSRSLRTGRWDRKWAVGFIRLLVNRKEAGVET